MRSLSRYDPIIDDKNIYYTDDGGTSWNNITNGYAGAVGLQSIAFVAAGKAGAVLVGGLDGVFESQGGTTGAWYQLGADLPNVPVYDMNYDPQDDILVIGTLGRGAWGLRDIRPAVFTPLTLLSVSTNTTTYTNLATVATIDVSPLQLTLHFNDKQVIDATTLAGIQITRAGPNGTFYDPVTTTSQGGLGGNIVTTERTDAENAQNDATDSTFVGATDLGNYSTSTPQSWVLSSNVRHAALHPGMAGRPGHSRLAQPAYRHHRRSGRQPRRSRRRRRRQFHRPRRHPRVLLQFPDPLRLHRQHADVESDHRRGEAAGPRRPLVVYSVFRRRVCRDRQPRHHVRVAGRRAQRTGIALDRRILLRFLRHTPRQFRFGRPAVLHAQRRRDHGAVRERGWPAA